MLLFSPSPAFADGAPVEAQRVAAELERLPRRQRDLALHAQRFHQQRAGQQQPQPAASDAGITTSVTGTSSPVTERTEDEHALATEENRRTLAERLLPKPRKTHVEECVSSLAAHAVHAADH